MAPTLVLEQARFHSSQNVDTRMTPTWHSRTELMDRPPSGSRIFDRTTEED